MRLGRFLLLVVAAAVVLSSCTSTTVVSERADRPAAVATSAPDEAAQDDEDEAAGAAEADDADEDDAGADDEAAEDDAADAELENEEPFGIGGDEQLAGLLEDCEGGSDQACDILFQLSPPDSAEEGIALTCAGRADEEVDFCTDGVEADAGSFFFDLDSAGLDDIATSCEEGDMTACDFLYFRSPVGSKFEQLGTSCGGRTTVAIPDCRTAIG